MAAVFDVLKASARFQVLRTDKSSVEALWDDIETYIMPATGKTVRTSSDQAKLQTDPEAWDLTAPLACEHLAASLHGMVTNPASRWVDFEWQDAELEKDQEARRYREELAALVWSELQASDFNTEIAAAYHEFAGIGNMILMVEAAHPTVWEGLDFTAIPCREAFIELDSRGGIRAFSRLLRWTPVQIVDKFGEKTPKWIREKAASETGGTEKLDVVFHVFRREGVPLTTGDEQPLNPDVRPFGSAYYALKTAELLGEEGGYYEMPVVHVPWGRVPGSVWGFGRGNIALRHAKYVCAFKESARAAQAKAANPPLVGTEFGVVSAPDQEEGGYTVVQSLDAIRALLPEARFDVSTEVLRDERLELRRCFHEDDLQLKESPEMTATEVQARRDLMDRVLGSPVGRIWSGGLEPIVRITIGHLARAKRLPEAPVSVKEKRAQLKVRFRGPIARAQVMDEVVAIERSAAFASSLADKGFTRARHYFDEGQAMKEHANRVGTPATCIRSEAEVRKLVEEERAAMARAANAEASKQEGEAALAMARAAAVGSGGGSLGIATQPALAPSGGSLA